MKDKAQNRKETKDFSTSKSSVRLKFYKNFLNFHVCLQSFFQSCLFVLSFLCSCPLPIQTSL